MQTGANPKKTPGWGCEGGERKGGERETGGRAALEVGWDLAKQFVLVPYPFVEALVRSS